MSKNNNNNNNNNSNIDKEKCNEIIVQTCKTIIDMFGQHDGYWEIVSNPLNDHTIFKYNNRFNPLMQEKFKNTYKIYGKIQMDAELLFETHTDTNNISRTKWEFGLKNIGVITYLNKSKSRYIYYMHFETPNPNIVNDRYMIILEEKKKIDNKFLIISKSIDIPSLLLPTSVPKDSIKLPLFAGMLIEESDENKTCSIKMIIQTYPGGNIPDSFFFPRFEKYCFSRLNILQNNYLNGNFSYKYSSIVINNNKKNIDNNNNNKKKKKKKKKKKIK